MQMPPQPSLLPMEEKDGAGDFRFRIFDYSFRNLQFLYPLIASTHLWQRASCSLWAPTVTS
jgi:hypothetical protein